MNRSIINMTIPTIIAMSSQTIMGIVNLIIVGSLGYEAIGAVGITNVIILNLFSFSEELVTQLIIYQPNNLVRKIIKNVLIMYIQVCTLLF